ncbi:hypothetical protein PISMIDRAFT_689677 [Pisolithus microcarpus 441]|uniref:Uncharacterized protein n=1 Tax=Pisolithus microcarpus 441 TaxID=765257 RepID=A0A0C9YEA3_9AGAM|nr:hypothetical protein PISMIDRAFT_689677 [Pisolithus microcarpus 441]
MMAFFSKRRRSSNTVGRISTCYKRQTMWSETGFGSSTHSVYTASSSTTPWPSGG